VPAPRVGDVVEIPTSSGRAYAQVVQKVRSHGPLLRVLDGFWEERPDDLASLVEGSARFYVFFPVGAAVSLGAVTNAGHVPVPAQARSFPLLRRRGKILADGRVVDWWLWDGEKLWRAGKLNDQMRSLSIAELVNDTLLVERLESGWRPEDEQ